MQCDTTIPRRWLSKQQTQWPAGWHGNTFTISNRLIYKYIERDRRQGRGKGGGTAWQLARYRTSCSPSLFHKYCRACLSYRVPPSTIFPLRVCFPMISPCSSVFIWVCTCVWVFRQVMLGGGGCMHTTSACKFILGSCYRLTIWFRLLVP